MLITLLMLMSSPVQAPTVISDQEAGYNQAAYDECMDSFEEVTCD